jgi:hypothetical protein
VELHWIADVINGSPMDCGRMLDHDGNAIVVGLLQCKSVKSSRSNHTNLLLIIIIIRINLLMLVI